MWPCSPASTTGPRHSWRDLGGAYALEAERKMGQMLRETERNPGAKPSKTDGGHMESPPSNVPTLADLGLTKRESPEAKILATMPTPGVIVYYISNTLFILGTRTLPRWSL